MTVQGKRALVTGAGSGIGQAIALMLAAAGAKVVVGDIDGERAGRTANAIEAAGGEAAGYLADVSRKDEVGGMFAFMHSRFGGIDILVNNAGIGIDGGIDEALEEDWDRVQDVTLKSTFLCSQFAARSFKAQRYGRIVNISSRMWMGGALQSSYSAAKGGVVSLTRTCAMELIEFGVTVNCIAPGAIASPVFAAMPAERKEQILSRQFVPGVIGQPEDVARAALFFASDESGYITGQVLHVCGGKSLGARW